MLEYVKAAAPMIPGASRLPWIAGGGGDMPDLERRRDGVEVDRDHLAAYDRVCGFRVRDELPATYPHVLAFPMHMDLMTDGRFPFGAVGLVHIANRITVHRPVGASEALDFVVRPTAVRSHSKGKAFALITEARVGDELVWDGESTILRRGGGGGEEGGGTPKRRTRTSRPAPTAEWKLPADLGRRYAAVSGDSNPIHMHALTARLLGFPRAIAHGMWTKARCLAALERRLPEAFTVEVDFKKPILLPARVGFGADGDRFAVTSGDEVHLEGEVKR
jgi:acyl dehydratase